MKNEGMKLNNELSNIAVKSMLPGIYIIVLDRVQNYTVRDQVLSNTIFEVDSPY